VTVIWNANSLCGPILNVTAGGTLRHHCDVSVRASRQRLIFPPHTEKFAVVKFYTVGIKCNDVCTSLKMIPASDFLA